MKPSWHPVLPIPTAEQLARLGQAAALDFLNKREKLIFLERQDPLAYGYDPPAWRLGWALLGASWIEADYAARLRAAVGFDRPVRTLLVVGGNRGSKSQFAAKTCMKILAEERAANVPPGRAWCLHSKQQMSVDYQQPVIFQHFPPAWRKQIKGQRAYVAYKRKTGFSDGSFVLPNLADCRFFNYTMDRSTIEGGNLDFIWPDELVPPDWVETMELRIAERNGRMVITFTPVEGYSFTVRMFQDGAAVTRSSIGYLLPTDGGPPDPARALGLSEAEYAEVRLASQDRRDPECLPCRPENCDAWLEGGTGQPEPPAGREFEMVPRVMKPSAATDPEGQRAVIFFHSSDNPYGAPAGVIAKILGRSAAHIRERFYGIAEKLATVRFPKFNEAVHVIPAARVPAAGTNYHIIDPASGRNFFMVWMRVHGEDVYAVREWPGYYAIPGHGVPGAWAIADGQLLDGRAGPAQRSFGWGYWRYKREIARLEGWADYEAGMPTDRTTAEEAWVEGLTPEHGAREMIQARYVDSRFASAPKIENDRPSTLLTDFAAIGVYLQPTPGDSIEDGVTKINNALDYDEQAPITFFNRPHFYISEECVNLRFALSVWTGVDGGKGATKDPIDVLRYFFLLGRGEVTEKMWESEGGGHY